VAQALKGAVDQQQDQKPQQKQKQKPQQKLTLRCEGGRALAFDSVFDLAFAFAFDVPPRKAPGPSSGVDQRAARRARGFSRGNGSGKLL